MRLSSANTTLGVRHVRVIAGGLAEISNVNRNHQEGARSRHFRANVVSSSWWPWSPAHWKS